MEKKQLELDLMANAICSLEEGLKHYKEALKSGRSSYKYSAQCFAQYIELSLKFFVFQIHEKGGKHTIKPWKAINILGQKGVVKDGDEFKKMFNWLIGLSNSAKHHELKLDPNQFDKEISQVLDQLDLLYDDHEVCVSEKISPIIKEFYKTTIDAYKHKLHVAEQQAQEVLASHNPDSYKENSPISDEEGLKFCPKCDENTLVLVKSDESYQCTLCSYKDVAVRCCYCNQMLPESEAEVDIAGALFWCSAVCSENNMGSF